MAKSHAFRAETQKVLNILTHSLYTNREIFLRELLSNASDALDKVRFLQNTGETLRDAELPLQIDITVDKLAGVLQIADTGLGMSEGELVDNLGTIAKSGSEQFVREMEEAGRSGTPRPPSDPAAPNEQGGEKGEEDGARDETARQACAPSAPGIIGRFGIGFYSVFMVADLVEVISVPAAGDRTPHLWSSGGTGTFEVRELTGEEAAPCRRGTVVRAHLKEDAGEFLEKGRLESAIREHSNFLSFPVLLEGARINTTPALWREPKFSITSEQYHDFYRYLTRDSAAPLDVIHLGVDAPVQFNALIFIPDSRQDFFNADRDRWGLDLYVRRVLIEHANKELVPSYCAFLRGVVDTEDLPLNISRETLQENVVLRKIAQTVLRQVLGHLENLAATDGQKYERFWKLHGSYFKFAFNDYLNRDRVAPLLRFASSAGDALSGLDDYLARRREGQKDIWHIAAPSPEAARVNPHMERFRRKGIEVLYLLEPVDEVALEGLGKYKDCPFKSVEQAGAGDLDAFPDLEEAAPAPEALSAEDQDVFTRLVERIRAVLGDRILDVRVSGRLTGSPAVLASGDGLSSSMEKLLRVMQKSDEIPKKILELNPDHPLMRSLLRIYAHAPENPLLDDLVRALFDNVLLLDGYLHEPHLVADRALKLMDTALGWYADVLRAK